MKPWLIAGAVVLAAMVIGGGWLMLRAAQNQTVEVSATRAASMREQGALILDVRSQSEWDTSHVADSMLIPLDELPKRISEVPHGRTIVVVCSSGIRSRAGRSILVGQGYTNVYSLSGGLQTWKDQGYPMISR